MRAVRTTNPTTTVGTVRLNDTRRFPRRFGSSRVTRRPALNEEDVEWMIAEFKPWVTDETGARKCDAYMRENYGRAFSLEKAKTVLDSIKADHAKLPGNVPWTTPKTWPGMLLILERCGERIGDN